MTNTALEWIVTTKYLSHTNEAHDRCGATRFARLIVHVWSVVSNIQRQPYSNIRLVDLNSYTGELPTLMLCNNVHKSDELALFPFLSCILIVQLTFCNYICVLFSFVKML